MKRLKFTDRTKYTEYIISYNKAKLNRYFNVNTKQYRYISIVKSTLYSINILSSTIDAYILCSEYFNNQDPAKWGAKVFGLNDKSIIQDLISSRSFIEVVNKEDSQTSE